MLLRTLCACLALPLYFFAAFDIWLAFVEPLDTGPLPDIAVLVPILSSALAMTWLVFRRPYSN